MKVALLSFQSLGELQGGGVVPWEMSTSRSLLQKTEMADKQPSDHSSLPSDA